MVRLEKTLLDQLINKNLLAKRTLSRPLKPMYLSKEKRG